MKKLHAVIYFVLVLAIIASFFVGNMVGLSYDPTSTYTTPATVAEVNKSTQWVTLVDWNGEAWCIRDDAFTEGELVIVTFNDNQTESIYDDLIVEVRRANLVPLREVE